MYKIFLVFWFNLWFCFIE